MNIQPINNNNVGFSAKIKFANPELKSMVQTTKNEYAKNLLDKFEAFHPNESVLVNVETNSIYDKILTIKNLVTNKVFMRRLALDECKNPSGGYQTFYDALESLLDKTQFFNSKFWGRTSIMTESPKYFSLEDHSVFKA